MSQAVSLVFVTDDSAAAAAVEATLAADSGLRIAARVASAAEAGPHLAGADVVVLHASGPPDAARMTLAAAAQAQDAPLVVVNGEGGAANVLAGIRARVKAAASITPARARPAAASGPLRPPRGLRLIAVGASTGGVEALVAVLSRFPADTPPTVVVQHMPEHFTASFAARLHGVCAARVAEAWDGAPLERGAIYIAPGGPAHLEVQWTAQRRVRLIASAPVNRHRPSVDVAFHSIVREGVPGVAAALLTGMGRDGAAGLRAIRDAGGRTVAQDEASSTVYGMPKAALELGAVDHGTPLDAIAEAIFSTDAPVKETL